MPTSRDHAANVLFEQERTGGFVKEALAACRQGVTDPRDRALLTELVYGTLRRRGTLDTVLAMVSRRALPKLHAGVRTALRLGAYQLLFLDRVPAHAALDHAVGWTKRVAGPARAGYVNAVLRALVTRIEGAARGPDNPRRDVPCEDGSRVRLRGTVFLDPSQDLIGNESQRLSCPRWLVRRWTEHWGPERAADILRAGIVRPPTALRARADEDGLFAALREAGAEARRGPVAGSVLVTAGEHAALELVRAGRAAVQDPTSQRVAPLLDAVAGQHVLDLCASPGGKTLHIADRMQAGIITASDVEPDKLAPVEALRAVVPEHIDLRTVVVPTEGPLPFEPHAFDAILIDAPCSNTGVLRRRVEARWRLRPGDIDALARVQRDLLVRALPLLRPGGRLVYSTCSLEPEENEQVVAGILDEQPDFDADIAFRVFPSREADGGFAAVLERRS